MVHEPHGNSLATTENMIRDLYTQLHTKKQDNNLPPLVFTGTNNLVR